MQYDFDTVYNRTGTGCYKADALDMLFGTRDVLSLWVADMDFGIAPEILQAMQERLTHPIFGYNYRLQPYYEAIINWVDRRYGWQIDKDWIVNVPGVVTAINAAILVFTNPGDKILIQPPVYEQFYEAVHNNKRCLVTNPLKLKGQQYEIDFADLDQKLKDVKMFILCSPHNPVGRVWTRDELLQIGRLCKKHGVLVIADEIHADLVFQGQVHLPFAALEDFAEFTIACYSPSKSFNLAGLCNSAIVIPGESIRSTYREFIFNLHLYLGNTLGITALQAAYSKGEAWLEALMAYLNRNRTYLMDIFKSNKTGIIVIPPQATFLVWLDFRQTGLADEIIKHKLLYEAKVALNSGIQYGDEGRGFVRFNFASPLSVIKQACEQINRAFS